MTEPHLIFKRRAIKPVHLIIGVALLVRFGWVVYTPALPTSDFRWYNNRAIEITQGRGYSIDGTPTAFRVPGYPVFLAAVYAVSRGSHYCAQLANVLLGTLTVLLVFLLTSKVFSQQVALVAAAIVALTPSLILYSGLLASENLVNPLLLASLVFYLCALQKQRIAYVAFSGLMLGLATLTRPLVLFLPVFWLAYLFLKQRNLKTISIHALVFSICIGLCIVPWTLRNHRMLNRFIPLATESGITLLVSFNEKSVGRYVPDPHAHLVERGRDLGWDESELDQAALRESLRFIREHPVRAAVLAPLKVFHLFRDDVSGVIWNFAETSRPTPGWLEWVLLFVTQGYYMAIMGLALVTVVYRKSLAAHPWNGLLLMSIVYWIAFHFVIFGDDRFHLPLLPIIAIFSAFSLLQIVDRLGVKPSL